MAVLFRYGLDEYIQGIPFPHTVMDIVRRVSGTRKRLDDMPRGERVRKALEELGPTFIKFGQLLSTRSEMLPEDVITELERLQDHVPPFGYEAVEEIVREELGQSPQVVFGTFEPEPFASASLGQVHRARTREGMDVCVKVQRPDIRERIHQDLEILNGLSTYAEEKSGEVRNYRPAAVIEEVSQALEKELDYNHEAAHIRQFAEMFKNDRRVYIMRCFKETSSKRVLTMEFVPGVTLNKLMKMPDPGVNLATVADICVDAVLDQIFRYGFFHADPHPGNIVVMGEGQISFIDCGMVGRLAKDNRYAIADLFVAIVDKDAGKATKTILSITEHDNPDQGALEREMADLIARYSNQPLKDVSIGNLFRDLNALLLRHGIHIPPDFSMMMKAVSTLEGMVRELAPDMNMTRKLEPHVRRVQLERFHPRHLASGFADSAASVIELLRDLPEECRDILELIKRGRLKIDVEHKASDSFREFVNKIANRIAYALVVGALLVGSSIMVQSGIPPRWNGLPLIGVAGFLISGYMAMRLLFSIWKNDTL